MLALALLVACARPTAIVERAPGVKPRIVTVTPVVKMPDVQRYYDAEFGIACYYNKAGIFCLEVQ